MKALSFERNGRASYGIMQDGGVREASNNFIEQHPDLRAVLEAGAIADIVGNSSDRIMLPVRRGLTGLLRGTRITRTLRTTITC